MYRMMRAWTALGCVCLLCSCSLLVKNKLSAKDKDSDGGNTDGSVVVADSGITIEDAWTSPDMPVEPPPFACDEEPILVGQLPMHDAIVIPPGGGTGTGEPLFRPIDPQQFALAVSADGIPHIMHITPERNVAYRWGHGDIREWGEIMLRFPTGEGSSGVMPVGQIAMALSDEARLHLFFVPFQPDVTTAGPVALWHTAAPAGDVAWPEPHHAKVEGQFNSFDAVASGQKAWAVVADEGGMRYVQASPTLRDGSYDYQECEGRPESAALVRLAVAPNGRALASSAYVFADGNLWLEDGWLFERFALGVVGSRCPEFRLEEFRPSDATKSGVRMIASGAPLTFTHDGTVHAAYVRAEERIATGGPGGPGLPPGIPGGPVFHLAWHAAGASVEQPIGDPSQRSVDPISLSLISVGLNGLGAIFFVNGQEPNGTGDPAQSLVGALYLGGVWRTEETNLRGGGPHTRLAVDRWGRVHVLVEMPVPNPAGGGSTRELVYMCHDPSTSTPRPL